MSIQPLLNLMALYRRKRSRKPAQERVLLIPYNAIGDMLMTLPLFSALKQAKPEWQIEVLAHPRNAPVLGSYPYIDRIWSWDLNAKFLKGRHEGAARRALYQQPFSQVIYLGERASTVPLVRLQCFNTRTLTGLPFSEDLLARKGFSPALAKVFDGFIGSTEAAEPRFAKRMLSILPGLGVPVAQALDFSPYFELPPVSLPDSTGKTVLFNPCGSQTGNTLSDDKAAQIAESLLDQGVAVHVFDLPQPRQLLAKGPLVERIHFVKSPDICTAAAIISHMDLVLTTDTAIGHLGCAMQRPTVILREDQHWRAMCDPLSPFAQVLVSPAADDINLIPTEQIGKTVQAQLA